MRRGSLRGAADCLLILGLLPAVVGAGELDPARPESWVLPEPDLYGVASHDEQVWAVGYWGTVLRSRDGGASWTAMETPTRDTLYDVSFADGLHGWAVGENGTVLHTVDGGDSWRLQPVVLEDEIDGRRPLDAHLFGVCAVSPGEAWAVGDLGILLHLREGSGWSALSLPEEVFADDEVPDRILNAVDFPDPRHGWIVGEFGTTLRTADGGESWVGERRLLDAPPELYLYDVSAQDGRSAAAVGLAGSVLATEDGGATWQARRAPTSTPLYGISWLDSVGAAVGNRGEIFATADRGLTWRESERPRLFNWLGAVVQAGERRLYAVGEKGLVLRSDDGGASWVQLFGSAPPPLSGISVPAPGRSRELGPEGPRIPFEPLPEPAPPGPDG